MRRLFNALRTVQALGLLAALAGVALWTGARELVVTSNNPQPQAILCDASLPTLRPGMWVRLEGVRLPLRQATLVLGGERAVELRAPLSPGHPPAGHPTAPVLLRTANTAHVELFRALQALGNRVAQARTNQRLADTDPAYRAFLTEQGGPKPALQVAAAQSELERYLEATDLEPVVDVEGMVEAGEVPGQVAVVAWKRPRFLWPLLLTVFGGLGTLLAGLCVLAALLGRASPPEASP